MTCCVQDGKYAFGPGRALIGDRPHALAAPSITRVVPLMLAASPEAR